MIFKNSHIIENLEVNYNLDISLIEGVIAENRGKLSIITILSGGVMVSNCQLTLAYLSTATNFIVPAIYIENSVAFLESTYIKGNKEYLTMGILAYNSNIKTVNCVFTLHRVGGILCHIQENNKVSFHKTKFTENTGCGVFCKGFGSVLIQDNLFDKNHGLGINVIDSKNLSLIGNKITENLLDGAHLINCDGLIILNSFFKNKFSGLKMETNENREFSCKVMKNTVCENYQNGIVIKGYYNNPHIVHNDRIAYNNLSGICISDKASPIIKENKIFENMNQGILIVSESSASIENNEIYKNIKANIAFGGYHADKTKIIGNKIYGSRTEGIFLIKGKGGLINRNEIFDNNDGIIIVGSEPEISYNNIYNNIRTGVLLSDKSNVKLNRNTIHDNQFLGLFIRDKSEGEITDNDMNLNISQLYLSTDCSHLLKDIKRLNNISGRIDVASNCNIL